MVDYKYKWRQGDIELSQVVRGLAWHSLARKQAPGEMQGIDKLGGGAGIEFEA